MLLDPFRVEFFWSRVEKTDSCWLWTGAKYTNGYGYLYINTAHRKKESTHRFSYILHYRKIPEGTEPDHLCGVRACVNPNHLEAVSSKENTWRGAHPNAIIRRLRIATGLCEKGHQIEVLPNGRTKCRTCVREWKREYKRQRRAQGLKT